MGKTKKIKLYQVDAFTDRLFKGNPAAVCLMDSWMSDALMQSIAFENNLAETAFVVPVGEDFEIRWFTPLAEVDLCGHATLASAFVLFHVNRYNGAVIRFHSRKSGLLAVEKRDELLFLDFPTDILAVLPEERYAVFEKCIGTKPVEVLKGKTDYLAVIETESALQSLSPDLAAIAQLDARGLIVTAKGDEVDFVSRFFAPQIGVDEDPVTGSAHTTLLPFWAKKTGQNRFVSKQLSKRGGQLVCELKNDRCFIGGQARSYLTGEINLE